MVLIPSSMKFKNFTEMGEWIGQLGQRRLTTTGELDRGKNLVFVSGYIAYRGPGGSMS